MYNFAVGAVQFGRLGCLTSAAPLFNLSVSTVQFETVRVFNAGAIFIYEIYQNDLQNRIRQNTWVTKSGVIEEKILLYFGDKRVRDVKPIDRLHWQNIIMETT